MDPTLTFKFNDGSYAPPKGSYFYDSTEYTIPRIVWLDDFKISKV